MPLSLTMVPGLPRQAMMASSSRATRRPPQPSHWEKPESWPARSDGLDTLHQDPPSHAGWHEPRFSRHPHHKGRTPVHGPLFRPSVGGRHEGGEADKRSAPLPDLRGTAVTMLAEAGCSVPQIASITQHSLATATRILETYLAPTRHLATQAIAQFENAAATEFANRLQTRA